MIRFDAYSATMVGPSKDDIAAILFREVGMGAHITMHQGKGFHTFGERLSVKSDGVEVGAISWGGRQGKRLMFEIKGEHTPGAVNALRDAFPHRVTRVDSCADFDAPGAFEGLLAPCLQVKADHRLKGSKAGDWDDFPEDGRTLYLGSTASAVRVRLYEKGRQPEYRHLQRDDWTRIEVQARPAKEAKEHYSTLSAAEVWGASTWTRHLAASVLENHVDPHPAGTTYRLTERDRALAWMCKQYGPHLVSLAADLGGWKELGLTLGEMVKEQRQPRC